MNKTAVLVIAVVMFPVLAIPTFAQDQAIEPFGGRAGWISLQETTKTGPENDPLLRSPLLEQALTPWYEFKQRLDHDLGLQFAVSYTSLYQRASRTFTGEDHGASGVLEIGGAWTLLGRHSQQPGTMGIILADRHRYGTPISPSELHLQFGSHWQTALAYDEFEFVASELWWEQHVIKDHFLVRVGKVDAGGVYDYFKYKNPREGFLSDPFTLNNTIAYPGEGPGAMLGLTDGRFYLLAGIHDANGDGRKFDLKSFFNRGEYFTVVEGGWEPVFAQGKGSYQITYWDVDQRKDSGVAAGWGYTLFVEQQFGRFLPFSKYGHSGGAAAELTDSLTVGLAVEEMFGQENDVLGFGLSWGKPNNRSLDDQTGLEIFYRIQLLNEFAVTPSLQVIINPAANPTGDEAVAVVGVRTRTLL